MKLLSILGMGARTAADETIDPESFKISEAFENYVRNEIFTEEHYDLLERNHSFDPNRKEFLKSSCHPDFRFLDKRTRKQFWVEVKFRSEEYGGKINWCTEEQLRGYISFHKKTPVFIFLGIGGEATRPDALYLLSMTQARYTGLFESFVKKYEVPFDICLSSQLLWNR